MWLKIKEIILCCGFLLSTKKRQRYLIDKNACLFIGLQNLAKKLDDVGDVRSSMDVSSQSYGYLLLFAKYCNLKGIDQVKQIKLYSKS